MYLAMVIIGNFNMKMEEDADYEFVELYNNSTESVSLAGWNFSSDNIDFTLNNSSVEAGEYVLLARNPDTYPGSIGYGNESLSNSGETIPHFDSPFLITEFTCLNFSLQNVKQTKNT